MIELELNSFTSVPQVGSTGYRSLNFDARGRLLFSWVDETAGVKICQPNSELTAASGKTGSHRFPIVQRLSDDRWLVVEARCADGELNAAVYSTDFQMEAQFSAGDAIQQIIIDSKDRVWVSYFDESLTGGLRRFSTVGEVDFDLYNSSGIHVVDLYAMSVDRKGSIWVCGYPDFHLVQVTDNKAEVIVEHALVEGAHAISVGGHHAAFFGSYDGDEVSVCNLQSGELRRIIVKAVDQEIGRPVVASHGENIALLWEKRIYHLQLVDLIKAARI